MITATDSFHRTSFPTTVQTVIGTERYCLTYDFQSIWALRTGHYDTILSCFQQVFDPGEGEGLPFTEDYVRLLASKMGLKRWKNYTDFNGEMVGDIVCAMMPAITQCILAGEDFLQQQSAGRLPHWADADLPHAYRDGGRATIVDAYFLIAGELNRRSGGDLARNSFNQRMLFTDKTAKPQKKSRVERSGPPAPDF